MGENQEAPQSEWVFPDAMPPGLIMTRFLHYPYCILCEELSYRSRFDANTSKDVRVRMSSVHMRPSRRLTTNAHRNGEMALAETFLTVRLHHQHHHERLQGLRL